ncbi:MFS transporter [Thermodesulfobacteriota bacterium]
MRSIFYGWIIVATLFVVNFAIQGTGMLNMGLFIIPMCNDMGISRGLFGWLATSRNLSGGVSGFFIGRLLDRFGPRVLIPCSALVTGICVMGYGVSNHIVYLFLLFSITGISGLATAGGGILTTVPVAKWFVRRRGLAMGLSTLGMGVGAVTFVPVTQFLINSFGWRKAWITLAIISMSLIIPFALGFLRRQPEDMGLLPDGVFDQSENKVTHDQSNERDEDVWTVREAIRTRAFWLLNAAWVLWGIATGGSIHRMPYWIELGFDAKLVSFVFTIDAVCFTLMILGSGILLDRFPPRFIQAGAFAGVTFSLMLMLFASNTYHMLISVILFGLSAGTNMVSLTYLWASYYGRAFLGTIRGVTLPVLLTALAIGAPLTGYFYDYTGSYKPAWKLFIGVYIAGLVCMLAAKAPSKKPSNFRSA